MKLRNFFISLWETLEVILVAVISVLLVRYFIFQPFLVSGASMEPTFQSRDYLIIDEATYYFREPQRGDVIVFRAPPDPSTFFIKRIIGLPGEKIVLDDGIVRLIKGDQSFILKEDYLQDRNFNYNYLDLTLGHDEYFVMGDNRPNSLDSRSWGSLKEKAIIGVARLRLYPFTKIELFK